MARKDLILRGICCLTTMTSLLTHLSRSLVCEFRSQLASQQPQLECSDFTNYNKNTLK